MGGVERGAWPIHIEQLVHERRRRRRIVPAPSGIHFLPISPLEVPRQPVDVSPGPVVKRRAAQQADTCIVIGAKAHEQLCESVVAVFQLQLGQKTGDALLPLISQVIRRLGHNVLEKIRRPLNADADFAHVPPYRVGGVAASAQLLDSDEPRLRPYFPQGVTSLAGNSLLSLPIIDLFVFKLVSRFINPLVQEKPLMTHYGVRRLEQRIGLSGALRRGAVNFAALPAAG